MTIFPPYNIINLWLITERGTDMDLVEHTYYSAIPSTLKIKNRKAILNLYRSGETKSIAEISMILGISRQTVTKAINYFLDKGILIPQGKGASTDIGGKCPELYSLNKSVYFLCILVRWQRVSLVLTDVCFQQCGRWDSDPADLNNIQTLWTAIEQGKDILLVDPAIREALYGISVSIPGKIDTSRLGVVNWSPVFPQWGYDVSFMEPLQKIFPTINHYCFNHDANLTTQAARLKYSAECQNNDVLVMYTGEGISGGFIQDGKVVYKESRALGHIIVDPSPMNQGGCGSCGCLEDVIGRGKLHSLLSKDMIRYNKSLLFGTMPDKVSFRQLFEASSQGDELCREIVEQFARYFSLALFDISLCLLPKLIIFLGDYGNADPYFKETLFNNLKEHKVWDMMFIKNFNIKMIYDGGDIEEMECIGAAYVMGDEFFNDEVLYDEDSSS